MNIPPTNSPTVSTVSRSPYIETQRVNPTTTRIPFTGLDIINISILYAITN